MQIFLDNCNDRDLVLNENVMFYDPSLKERFKNGDLREKWFKQYQLLFGQADLGISRNQKDYHFFEWLGAIRIYEESGWLSLVEKYQFKNHKKQREIFKGIVPGAVFELAERGLSSGPQMPDLFVYSPDKQDWYFCEVKGDRDRISPTQGSFFAELAEISRKKIRLLRFKPNIPHLVK